MSTNWSGNLEVHSSSIKLSKSKIVIRTSRFLFLTVDTEFGTSYQHNTTILACYFIRGRQNLKEAIFFQWWWPLKTNSDLFLGFNGSFYQNYFAINRDIFHNYHFERNTFINITKNNVLIPASMTAYNNSDKWS